ncbi:MAG: hypothetical protein WC494_03555 [Candidatus Pacearchaeota archaeon]
MKLKLFPIENFDNESIGTIKKLIKISEDLLDKSDISVPRFIEFYDELELFIKRILPQVKDYGLTEKQSKEFIKASLNSGTYGTFDIKENSIVEMNFNPHFKLFYPSIHFLKLLIHESLHLFLYENLKQDIYKGKFKFKEGEYIGYKEIIQLDEGFAEFLTDKILEKYDFNLIKDLPIYSGLNTSPSYLKEIEGVNIIDLNKKFNNIYEENSNKGYEIVEKKFNQSEGTFKEKIKKIINFIQEEIDNLPKHK